jgi:hypothetical protein
MRELADFPLEVGGREPPSPNGAIAISETSEQEDIKPLPPPDLKASTSPEYKDYFEKLLNAQLIRSDLPFSIKTVGGIKLFTQIAFSGIVIGFCIWQLSHPKTGNNEADKALYWGGITTLVAWWMPSPRGGT